MDTETMIRELERVEEKHKHDKVFTGQLDVAKMAYDTRKRLEELKPYEDTGLDPEQIVELKERDTAKIVNLIPFDGCDDDSDITYKAYCPICKRYIGILFKKGYKGKGDNFCRNCGQRLKWEE